jgi:hypothetical protein
MDSPEVPTPPEAIGTVLTPEQTAKAIQWLRANWGDARECPFHGPTNWEVGNILVATVGFTRGGLQVGGSTYPSFVVICGQCGFTVFVNAIKAGIVKAPEVPPAEPEESGPSPEPAAALGPEDA